MAVTPAPTTAGVFGMARTTTGWPPSAVSRRTDGTPATIDSTRVTPAAPRIRQAPSAASGLTASTAPAHCSATSSAGRPGASESRRPGTLGQLGRRSADRSRRPRVARRRPAGPEETPSRALPILPPPTMSRDVTCDGRYPAGTGAAGRPPPVRYSGGGGVGKVGDGPASSPSGSGRRRRSPRSRRSGPARRRRSSRPGPCPPGRRRPRGRG